jgi:hypothetical protein
MWTLVCLDFEFFDSRYISSSTCSGSRAQPTALMARRIWMLTMLVMAMMSRDRDVVSKELVISLMQFRE